MATYEQNYSIFLTDASACAAAQAAFPDGILTAPDTAAATYAAPVNPAPPTFGEGQCIWTGSITTALPSSVDSVTIPAGFIYAPDNANPIFAFAGSPGGTLRWRGFFNRRGIAGTVATKEALQTHRWMVGFERSEQGENTTGTVGQQFTRAASRTLEGLGMALRSPANTVLSIAPPQLGTGFPTRRSWERIYVCLRKYPTANEQFWGCKGDGEAGTAGYLAVGPSGQISIFNKGNQVWPGTFGGSAGSLQLNVWTKIDLLINFASSSDGTGLGNGSLRVYINGNLAGQMAGGHGLSTGLGNTIQTHTSSFCGNENTPSTGLEMDYDDWTNKTQPQQFTGDDWMNGTHIQPLAISGFGPTHSGTWTGAFQTIDGIPLNGQNDFLINTTASAILSALTDYQDRQGGCSGLQFNLYTQTSAGAAEFLGYSINGAAAVLQAINTNGATYGTPSTTVRSQVLYTAGGSLSAPLLTSVAAIYQRDATSSTRRVNVVTVNAEYIGVWGSEDPINLSNPAEFPPRQGPHNSPYFEGMVGQTAFSKGPGIVESFAGTYVGNGTGQDITIQMPAHWIWIRPLSGGLGGSRWYSSMLGGHDAMLETPDKENLIRCFQTSNTAGPSGYKFRVSGAQANSNANGVTYQYVAFSDRTMRFLLNGAFLTAAATASFSHPLFDIAFTPTAGFLIPEIGSAVSTTGHYYKGPGHATNAASLMDSAESASVVAFGAGAITPKAILNLSSSQTAYSLWRTTDSDAVSGPVAIMTYTGDGTGARNIALALGGRSPLFVMVLPHNAVAYVRDPSHTVNDSTPINSTSASTTAITAGAPNQITVGATLNSNAIVYDVFALAGSVAAGWSPNPTEPIPLVDPIPPTTQFPPTSVNGWWVSTNKFTGAAALTNYPPQNPHDARDWQKINVFATGGAGYMGGSPGPSCMFDNFFIYAGNDYQINGTQPTIRVFDGLSDRLMVNVPDAAGVKAIAIISMLSVGEFIYFTTLDSGTSSSTWAGRVFRLDPKSQNIIPIGAGFSGGEVPYALCFHMNRLWLGTNKGNGATGKIYFFRPDQDTAWTTDYTLSTLSAGGCLSLASFNGYLYVGTDITAGVFAQILKRDSLGVYTSDFTPAPGGTARVNNGFPSLRVFGNYLFAGFWNNDTTAQALVYRLNNGAWETVYTGATTTLRPYVVLFEAINELFVVGAGMGLSASIISSTDGVTWVNKTGFLTGPTTTETALPIVGVMGS